MPGARNARRWTAAAVQHLSALHKSGLAPAAIAKKLSRILRRPVTAAMVTSKLERLGIKPKPISDGRTHRRSTKARPAAPSAPREPASPNPTAMIDLGPAMCRWPIGDPRDRGFHFCGCPAPIGRPYCDAHEARAWASPQPRPIDPEQLSKLV